MKTFLLTWNPAHQSNLNAAIREFRKKGYAKSGWSCGNRKYGIEPGHRFFMLRQGADRPGIIGAGQITSGVEQGGQWNSRNSKKEANYIRIRYESLLDVETGEFLAR